MNRIKFIIKKTFSTICIVFFGVNTCTAQSSNSQMVGNWGESVQDVQLSITLSNNFFAIGSAMTITAEIKNSSTNVVNVGESSYNTDFDVFIMNKDGKSYRLTPVLTPAKELSSRMIFRELKPGKSHAWAIPIIISKDIEPGDYTLEATRSFSVNGSSFKLESNLLKVQVK